MNFSFLLTLLINFTLCLAISDMFGGKLNEKDTNCSDVNQCRVYMTRFLNQLLKKTKLKNYHLSHDGFIHVPIEISIDSSSLWTIQSFARNEQKFSWEELDSALTSIFAVENEKKKEDEQIEMEDIKDFNDSSYSDETIIISVISFMVFTVIWLVLHNVSIMKTILLLFFIAFSVGFGITWYTELQNARIDDEINLARMNGIPEECYTQPSFWNGIKTFFLGRTNKCKDYHWAQVKPIKKIVVSEIFVKTFSNMVMTPMPIIGEALGKMTYNYSSNLPLASGILTWIIFPLLTPVVFLMLVIFFMTLMFRRSFTASLPFFSYSSHQPELETKKVNGLTDSNNSPDNKKGKWKYRRIKDSVFKKPLPKSVSESNVLKDKKKFKSFFRQRSEISPPSSINPPAIEATSHTDYNSSSEDPISLSDTSDCCNDPKGKKSPKYKGQLPVRYQRYSDKKLVSSEDKYF